MAEEIKKQFTGVWTQYQDDCMPPFLDAVGTLEEEKQYLLKCHPQMEFSVDGDTITIITTADPEKDKDIKADVKFTLGQEFQFQPTGHLLKVTVEWKDNKIIQHLEPIQSHLVAHTIELYIDKNKDLVQVYKVTDSQGKVISGTRKYQQEQSTKS